MRRSSLWALIVLLAAFAGCSQPVVTPISQEPVSNIPSYFWTSSDSSRTFSDTSGVVHVPFSFSESTNGTLIVNEGGFNNINCLVNQDSVYAWGFSSGSFLNLGTGSYFSSLDTDTIITQPPSAILISENPRQVIVATDSGMYFYNPGGGDSIFHNANSKLGNVTALTQSSNDTLYAGTSDGQIFSTHIPLSSSSGWSSQSYPAESGTAIRQLIWMREDSLFATFDGMNGIYASNGGSWRQVTYLTASTVTALGKFQSSNALFLLAGTSNGQIGAHSLDASQLDASPATVGTETIYCFGNASGKLFAGTGNGVYSCTALPSNNWSIVTSSYQPVTSLAANGSQIIFLSNGSLFTIPIGGSTPTKVQQTPTSPVRQVGWNATSPWALTNRDYDTEASPGAPFLIVPGLPRGYWPYDTGGLVLLRNTLFNNDSSWRAGTLVTQNHQSYRITARVLGHLDSLVVASSGTRASYSDVLMVRYAHELTGEFPEFDSIPYWVVYYAKNKGPVMFDNVNGANGSSQQYVVHRWELGP